MLNHCVLMGRLAQDPTIRYTQSLLPVVSFSVACERDYADVEGKRETDFIPVVAWRGAAEFVSKYFRKGSMIVVDGRLQLRDWTTREGDKRRTAEIIANTVYFGEARRRDDEAQPPEFEELPDDEGELPF